MYELLWTVLECSGLWVGIDPYQGSSLFVDPLTRCSHVLCVAVRFLFIMAAV